MRFLIAAVLVLSCSLCLAEDLLKNINEIEYLTVESAAELVRNNCPKEYLRKPTPIGNHHNNLTVYTTTKTRERWLRKDVATELVKFQGSTMTLGGLTSMDKEAATELAKFKGQYINLPDLNPTDRDVLKILKSNPRIRVGSNANKNFLPKEHIGRKD